MPDASVARLGAHRKRSVSRRKMQESLVLSAEHRHQTHDPGRDPGPADRRSRRWRQAARRARRARTTAGAPRRLPQAPGDRGRSRLRGLTKLAARKQLKLDIKATPGTKGFTPIGPLWRVEHAFAQLHCGDGRSAERHSDASRSPLFRPRPAPAREFSLITLHADGCARRLGFDRVHWR